MTMVNSGLKGLNHGDQTVFFQFEIIINSFEYLCFRSTAIRNIFTPTVRGSTLDVLSRRLQTSNPHDEAKHDFASLKNDLITYGFLESNFLHLPPTSSDLHPLQVETCSNNSRLAVD